MFQRNNCDENATKSLRTQYTRPYFLPTTSESKTSDWIFMGSPGYGAQMHVSKYRFFKFIIIKKKNTQKVFTNKASLHLEEYFKIVLFTPHSDFQLGK